MENYNTKFIEYEFELVIASNNILGYTQNF